MPPASSSTPQHVLRKVNDLHPSHHRSVPGSFPAHLSYSCSPPVRTENRKHGCIPAVSQYLPAPWPAGSVGAYWLWKSSPEAAGWPGGGYIAPTQPGAVGRAGTAVQRVATAANGFPEREKIGLPPVSPAAICPPGFMITWSNSSGSAIWESNSGIRSVLPTATAADGNHCVTAFQGITYHLPQFGHLIPA